IKQFCANIGEIHAALTNDRLSSEAAAPFRAAFRNIFDRIIVHPTLPRKHYEATPHFRMAAILGVDLNPRGRSVEEMLQEQGGIAPLDDTTGAHGNPEWSSNSAPLEGIQGTRRNPEWSTEIVTFGRWQEAA